MASPIPNNDELILDVPNQSTRPVSESLMFSHGGAINQALTNTGQVGDCVDSVLTLPQFQALRDTTWVACDGSPLSNTSELYAITGMTNVPDARGCYPRCSDTIPGSPASARDLDPHGYQNPQAFPNYIVDAVQNHEHEYLIATSGSGSGGTIPLITTAIGITTPGAEIGTFTQDILVPGSYSPGFGPTPTGARKNGYETSVKTAYYYRYIKINT